MSEPGVTAFDPPRSLTPAERGLLDFLIEANTRHSEKLRSLFRDAKVTSECNCGCGSITLTTDPTAVETRTWPSPLPVDARAEMFEPFEGRLPDNPYFLAFLFAELDRGYLESTWHPGGRFPLPRKEDLRAVSNQWCRASRKSGTPEWVNLETGERRHADERPADLTNEELDAATADREHHER